MTLTITTGRNGRLGNQIIRNLVVSFIAKKHDLFVKYFNYDLIKKLGIELHIGNKVYKKMLKLTENNYFDTLLKEEIDYNLNPNSSYFQTQDISDLIFKHLNSLEIKNNIIFNNPFNVRYQNNNDVFLHIRLTDASKYNPGSEYYLYCLSKLKFDNIYIATDEPDNVIIKKILNKYPLSNLYLKNEI